MAQRGKSILLYGDSGDGKTALIGEMAEHIIRTEKKRTRLYSSDRGGSETIRPYIDDIKFNGKPVIELVELGSSDPWMFLNKAARGYLRDGAKWVPGISEDLGLYAFEGMTSIADALMQSLAKKAADGTNIGGGGNVNFNIAADGETIKVGGNNQAHYGVVQTRIVEEVWESQRLPGWLIWTAAVKRDEDPNAAGKVLGPAVAGKALTGEVPRWFVYTFRVAAVPGSMGAKERHILHLGDHQDVNAGGAKGLGNTRVPLDASSVPATIEPASLVKALEAIGKSYPAAVAAIKLRLGQ